MTSLSAEVQELLSLFRKVNVESDGHAETPVILREHLAFRMLPLDGTTGDMMHDCRLLGGRFSSLVNLQLRQFWNPALAFADHLNDAYQALVDGNFLLSLLLSTSILESVIREAVKKKSTLMTIPHKLCDLLLVLEEHVDNSSLIRSLSALSGPIHGVNVRNLAWHGFLTNGDSPETLCAMIIVCCFTVVHQIGITQLPKDVQVGVLPCSSLPRPSSAPVKLSRYPVRNKDQWELAFSLYAQGDALSSMSLLFALNEHSIRHLYGATNGDDTVLITASTTELCATLDTFLETHNDNRLFDVLPHDLALALLDGFYWKNDNAGRLRDHIAHGSRTATLEQALFFFSLATALLEHFSDGPKQPYSYVSLFHPISTTVPLFEQACARVDSLRQSNSSRFDAIKQRVDRLCSPGFVCYPVMSLAEKKNAFSLLTATRYVIDICEALRQCRSGLEERRDTHRNTNAQKRAQKKLDNLDVTESEIRVALQVALHLILHLGGGRRLSSTFEVDLANVLGSIANCCRQKKVGRALALLLSFAHKADDPELEPFIELGTLSQKEVAASGTLFEAIAMPDVLLVDLYGQSTALWAAGVLVERHFAALENFEMKGCSVLELGAGAGFLSVCLAHRGALVTATEMPGKEVGILNRTVARFQHLLPAGGLCAKELLWGADGWAHSDIQNERFDFVVGADLTYDDEDLWPLLIYTMDQVVTGNTIMFLGFTNREDFGMAFLSDLHDFGLFKIDGIDMDNGDLKSEDTEVYLFVITRAQK